MNKKAIQKEVSDIRKLKLQSQKIDDEVKARMTELAVATCPWKKGDVVEWTAPNLATERGEVLHVHPGDVRIDKGFEKLHHTWEIYVVRYRRGTRQRTQEGRRFRDGGENQPRAYEPPVQPVTPGKRYRPLPWIDLKNEREMFGIQISLEAGSWKHYYAENGFPQVFPTRVARDKKLKELRDAAKKP